MVEGQAAKRLGSELGQRCHECRRRNLATLAQTKAPLLVDRKICCLSMGPTLRAMKSSWWAPSTPPPTESTHCETVRLRLTKARNSSKCELYTATKTKKKENRTEKQTHVMSQQKPKAGSVWPSFFLYKQVFFSIHLSLSNPCVRNFLHPTGSWWELSFSLSLIKKIQGWSCWRDGRPKVCRFVKSGRRAGRFV